MHCWSQILCLMSSVIQRFLGGLSMLLFIGVSVHCNPHVISSINFQLGQTLGHCILELHCLIDGDDHKNIFQINIQRAESVARLRKAIKVKNREAFHNVDACVLSV